MRILHSTLLFFGLLFCCTQSFALTKALRTAKVKLYFSQDIYTPAREILDFSSCPTDVTVDVISLDQYLIGSEHGQSYGSCFIKTPSKKIIEFNYNLVIKRFPEAISDDNIQAPPGYFYNTSFDFRNPDVVGYWQDSNYGSTVIIPLESQRLLFFPFNVQIRATDNSEAYDMWISITIDDTSANN